MNFIFEERNKKISVYYNKDEEKTHLCDLTYYHFVEYPYWKIDRINYYDEYNDQLRWVKYSTKEEAAQSCYIILSLCKKITEAKPLPDNITVYLREKCNVLKEREQKISHEFLEIRAERYRLRQFAKENGLENILWGTEDSDGDLLMNELVNFPSPKRTKEGKEIPFFSESYLYKLLGKDSARSLLGLMRRVCELVSPKNSIKW